MSKLPELVAAAKCVIENVDSDALLSYFGLKTDLREGACAIKVYALSFFCLFLSSIWLLMCTLLFSLLDRPVFFKSLNVRLVPPKGLLKKIVLACVRFSTGQWEG